MLTIKLAKVGKTNKKMFRIVISEKTRDPYGRALEILGSYNPYTKELKVKGDRVKHWIKMGSGMTPSINNLFIENKVIEGKKEKNSKPGEPNKRKVEKIEKAKQKEEDAKKAIEAAKEAEKAAKEAEKAEKEAAAAAPAETAPVESEESKTEEAPAEVTESN